MKKKMGSSKSMKKYAMAGEVGPGPKKKTPFQQYESKYPGYGSDTLRTPAERSLGFDDYDWLKKSAAQKAALGSAFKKTYSNYDSKTGWFRDEDGDLGGPAVRKPGLKKGGSVGTSKKPKMGMGGTHMMPDGSMMKDSMMKKGGSVKTKKQAATAIGMKAAGKKPKMAMGGSLKNVPTNKVGLSKLPKAVRNKMGYKKIGGSC